MDDGRLQFQQDIVSLISKEDYQDSTLIEKIEELSSPPLDSTFYSAALELFVHSSFTEDEAKQHWNRILDHHDFFLNTLKYKAGLRAVIFDYFANLNKVIHSPIIVEMHVFKETEKMALVDPLTGIFNRRYFDFSLKKELKRALRYDKDFSLIMIDIDDFKNVNDIKGHLFGDKVLKELSFMLMDLSREEDIVSRYGGEEFMIILPETNAKGAKDFCERIRQRLHADDFFNSNAITVSGGIASYPYGGRASVELIQNADTALYEAKFSGKDRFHLGSADNRRLTRFNETWAVSYKTFDASLQLESKAHETITLDVSFGGIKIEVEQQFNLGTNLSLSIILPDLQEITTSSTIVWAKKSAAGRFIYGLKFTDLRPEQLQAMKSFLPEHHDLPELSET